MPDVLDVGVLEASLAVVNADWLAVEDVRRSGLFLEPLEVPPRHVLNRNIESKVRVSAFALCMPAQRPLPRGDLPEC